MTIEQRANLSRVLLHALLDDAALFPPGSLPMSAAVPAHYARRESPQGFAQGPFVLAVDDIQCFLPLLVRDVAPLRVSLLVDSEHVNEAISAIESFVRTARGAIVVDTLELRLPTATLAQSAFDELITRYARTPHDGAELLIACESSAMQSASTEATALAGLLQRADSPDGVRLQGKVRTGNVDTTKTPDSDAIAEFIIAMARAGLPWKATAGLHHAIRRQDGHGFMHGFLNVLIAARLANSGAEKDALLVALNDGDVSHFECGEDALTWRGVRLSTGEIAETRATSFRSFGTCSFDEPVDELRALGFRA